jgi:hypothetical protein
MNKKKTRRGQLLLVMGMLTACGGGGGGGGSSSGTPPPDPITYTGSTAALDLTTSNAAEVVTDAWNAIVIAQSLADFATPIGDVTGHVSESRNGPEGGSLTITGNLTNGRGELSVSFDNYRYDGISLDGQYSQTIHNSFGSQTDSLSLDIARLTITGGFGPISTTIVVSGQVDRQLCDACSGSTRTVRANLVFRDEQTGEAAWIRDLLIDRHHEVPPIGSRLVETYSGQIYDSQLGVATLGSTEGLWFYMGADLPYGGGALKVSSNGKAVRLRPTNARYVALLFDDSNDGISDRSKLMTWDDLLSGTPPTPGGDQPPLVATVTPGPVSPGESVELNGYLSSDLDGDWLTVEWRLELSPVGSTATVAHPQSPEARLTTSLAGDHLLTLRVSDGRHDVWDSARVTAADFVPAEPGNGTPIAVLRRPLDSPVGQPIELDGTLSFSTKVNDVLAYDWTVGNAHGTSMDGLFNHTPDKPGLYVPSVEVRRNGYHYPSTTAERIVSVGLNIRYFIASSLNTGFVARTPIIGDFDGDGRRDLAMPSTSMGSGTRPPPDSIDVIFSRDTGVDFEKIPVPASGRSAAGDLSGDGREDIAIVGESTLYIARRGATGPFSVETFPLGGCSEGSGTHLVDVVAIVDANADGRADLLHLDTCAGTLVTRLQTAGGILAASSSIPMAIPGGQLVAFGDLNSDSRADILSGSPGSSGADRGKFLALISQADGSYVAGQEFSLIDSSSAPSVAIGDVTGDGRNDAIASDYTHVLIARQLSNGTLASPDSYQASEAGSGDQLLVADYDGDGRQDLRANGGAIFLQEDAGGLLPGFKVPSAVGGHPWLSEPQPMDLNGDGLIDLVGHEPDGYRSDESSGPLILLGRPPDT